jgi:hypothetical protein
VRLRFSKGDGREVMGRGGCSFLLWATIVRVSLYEEVGNICNLLPANRFKIYEPKVEKGAQVAPFGLLFTFRVYAICTRVIGGY